MDAGRSVSAVARPDRLGLKLTGLFLVSLAFSLLMFIAYEMLASVGESAAVAPAADQTTIVIDPKIEADLAKVLAFDSLPSPGAVRDPFSDRGNLSRAATPASATVAQSGTGTTVTIPSAGGPGKIVVPGAGGTSPGTSPPVSAVAGTKQRYEMWLARQGLTGESPLDPTLFAIEDLLPVGIVDGGSGQHEVMFFSEAAGKTLSFPIGTMFYDGWLIELRPEGVLFSSNDERKTLRMRSWARSIRNAG
jgi:hypothetical protein